jgi:hypothetical protein
MNRKTSIQAGALAVLVLIAGSLWYRAGNSAGASDREAGPSSAYRPMSIENLQIHWDRLDDTRETEYQPTGRDIFSLQLPAPPPPPVVHIPQPGDADFIPPQAPPPPPPKLPLKFFGVGTTSKGSARRAFLTDGSEVFIVAEGEIVFGHYRVLKISAASLEFEDIASGRRASKPLEDSGPPA